MAKTKSTAPAPDDGLSVNEKKWTKALMKAGWTVIPNVIFERQQALGLDPLDINILLHLAGYWWNKEGRPHPSKKTVATAIGVDPRTVQRRIALMEAAGLVRRQERRLDSNNNLTNIYHLDGLIKAATPFARERIQEREAAEAKRKERAAKKRPHLRLVKNGEDD